MGEEPRPVRVEWRPGMSLTEYAARWVDMMPHIDALTEYAKGARTIVEFGVRGGVSTWALLRGLPEDGRIVSVDIDEDVFRMTPPWVLDDPRLELVIGDDLEVPLPDFADLVVIDSGHEYQQTLTELDRASEMSPERIVLHDYLYAETPGVRLAVDRFVVPRSRRGDGGPEMIPITAFGWHIATVHPSQWGLAVLERDEGDR